LLISLPIMGRANCGSATAYADNTVEGYLKVSRSLLWTENPESLFVLKAKGDSMNKSDIHGNSIEDGDFVIVDESKKSPQDKDYIVSLIDDYANIKRFFSRDGQIALVSESTKDYNPIFIHEDDADSYNVIGRVVKVIKTPKF
jgi:SOS-response transcriptional repressor LexA